MNILNTIIARKKEEVLSKKQLVSESELIQSLAFERQCLSFSEFVLDATKTGIIAEFKRKSPSKPSINLDASVADITQQYTQAGASCLSVLTDVDFFGGCDNDVVIARSVNQIPILRKDFVIDPYQILEAKCLGADAILLIAEILTKPQIHDLTKLAVECGMEVLLELHTTDQLVKYNDQIRNVGVNNRDLKTFTTNIQNSKSIFSHLPSGTVKISESGIHDPKDVIELKAIGYQGFLIGETFMKSNVPGQAFVDFVAQIKSWS